MVCFSFGKEIIVLFLKKSNNIGLFPSFGKRNEKLILVLEKVSFFAFVLEKDCFCFSFSLPFFGFGLEIYALTTSRARVKN